MSWLSNLFKGGSSESTTTSYTPEQKKWLDEALGVYGQTLGKGQESFPGQRVAPLSPDQTTALDVGDFLKYFSPDANIPMYGETGTALSGILGGKTGATPISKEAGEDYFKSVYADPTKKRWGEFIRPEIESSFTGPGYWSSARAGATARGATEMGDWLGEKYGQTMWDIDQANRAIEEAKAGRALSAVGMGMDYGGVPTREAGARLAGRGGVFDFLERERTQRQAEINVEIQRFAEANRITDPENLEILMNLLNMGFSTGTSSSQGPGLGYSALSGLFGGLGVGMGSAMMTPQTSSPSAWSQGMNTKAQSWLG